MTIVDLIQLEPRDGVGKAELLIDGAVLVNIPILLLLHVNLTTIQFVTDHVPQVEQLVNPGQRIATKHQAWERAGFIEESQSLCFALNWVNIGGES